MMMNMMGPQPRMPRRRSAAGDLYSAGVTADDLAAAARDLGLTEDEVAACSNPK
jgi:hypothetical protein